jgi:hypothetical protein
MGEENLRRRGETGIGKEGEGEEFFGVEETKLEAGEVDAFFNLFGDGGEGGVQLHVGVQHMGDLTHDAGEGAHEVIVNDDLTGGGLEPAEVAGGDDAKEVDLAEEVAAGNALMVIPFFGGEEGGVEGGHR